MRNRVSRGLAHAESELFEVAISNRSKLSGVRAEATFDADEIAVYQKHGVATMPI